MLFPSHPRSGGSCATGSSASPRHLVPALVLGLVFFALAAPGAAEAVSVTFRCEAAGASSVYLAGEFNSWSPNGTLMEDPDGDGVFEAVTELEPGRYQYKFVVDGTWKEDPNSAEHADDGFGGKNSVLVVPAGLDAMVASELGAGGAAAGVAAGGAAAGAAVLEAPEGERNVRFRCVASPGATVFLAGEFNSWNATGEALSDEGGDGVFEVVTPLSPGRYAYKYVIDGTWEEDPNAVEFVDDGFGGKNGLVYVELGEGVQEAGAYDQMGDPSVSAPVAAGAAVGAAGGEALTGSRAVTFKYQPVIGGVNEVFLAGTFNDWNVGATPMKDPDGDGTYEATLMLAAGSYQYKFVVDGNWITPDDADDYAEDGFGGKNGVINVDDRFSSIDVEVGDGEFYLTGLDVVLGYATLNHVADDRVIFQAQAYRDDIERVVLHYQEGSEPPRTAVMAAGEKGPTHTTHRTEIVLVTSGEPIRFLFAYEDGDQVRYTLASGGFAEDMPPSNEWVLYTEERLPRFKVPQWAQTGIFYQIFPERFANGDPSNDQDFSDSYYDTRKTLPVSGKTNGEYFHFVEDWNDVAGLKKSPFRTDGKPDYYSFYGGDIRGVMDKIPYLADLGVSIIYFNPITDARSNHRYDPCDYNKLDPHLGTEEEFQEFTKKAFDAGIRVMIDMAFNHTGDCHFAFQDVVANWTDSEYYDWYEWKKRPDPWPLPVGSNSLDYYDCWWGFGLHPNLNFDKSRPNAQENGIRDIEDADPNWDVVNNVLDSADYWLGKMGCSGFRLDVPNEVPFWFWTLFRERCREVKEDHFLVGEIWGDAGEWIAPDVFDAVMNYRYFKDPVVKWIGQKQGNAATFDQELAPGRTRYPIQAVRAQMNLVDSHDTVRFLNAAGSDARRLELAATFAMTYVGAPHIYYGDEIAMAGDKDPDCRRTMPWDQLELPARKGTLEHYRTVTGLRHELPALTLGTFTTVLAKGQVYAYLREYDGQRVLTVLNNGDNATAVLLPMGEVGVADTENVRVVLGDASVLTSEGGDLSVTRGAMRITVPGVGAAVLVLAAGS